MQRFHVFHLAHRFSGTAAVGRMLSGARPRVLARRSKTLKVGSGYGIDALRSRQRSSLLGNYHVSLRSNRWLVVAAFSQPSSRRRKMASLVLRSALGIWLALPEIQR